MNVKTIKRISKRSVSMLLSVLMVLSLFTVCLVGTTLNAAANWNVNQKVTVDVPLPEGWNNAVYLYIGNRNYISKYKFTYNSSTRKYECNVKWDKYDMFFFADGDYNTADNDKVYKTYQSIPEEHKSKRYQEELRSNYSFVETYTADASATIYFDNSETKWDNVYLVYGGIGGDDYKSYKAVELTQDPDRENVFMGTTTYSYNTMYGFFFTNKSFTDGDSESGINGLRKSTSAGTSKEKTQLIQRDLKNNLYFVPNNTTSDGYSVKVENEPPKVKDYVGEGSVLSLSGATIWLDVSAIDSNHSGTYYLYVGRNAGAGGGYTSQYAFSYDTDSGYFKCTGMGDWLDRDGYFITTSNLGYGDGKKVLNDVYNSDTSDKKTGYYTEKKQPIADGNLYTYNGSSAPYSTTVSVYYPKTLWVDATLYNYRNYTQIEENDDWEDGEAENQTGKRPFSTYNAAVADWYRTNANNKSVPLYQGNTLDCDWVTGTFANMFWHYVRPANGANRNYKGPYSGDYDHSTKAVAYGLVDPVLGNKDAKEVADMKPSDIKALTVSQYGLELPQFSSTFKDTYNNQQKNLEYGPNGDFTGIQAYSGNNKYSFGTIQTEYSGLSFQFDKETTTAGNDKYYYYAGANNNRYYDPFTKTLRKGSSIHGTNNTKYGYYPFNKVQPAQKGEIVNCYGTRFDIEFEMPSKDSHPSTGEGSNDAYQMKGTNGYEDLVFNFYGDDDVWVYIDGYLALDLGGSHNGAGGSVNLSKGTYTINTGYYYSGDYTAFSDIQRTSDNAISAINASAYGNPTTDATKTGTESIHYSCGVATTKKLGEQLPTSSTDTVTHRYSYNTDDGNAILESLHNTEKTHTLTVFYLERGEFDSNFAMDFMLPVTASEKLDVIEKVDDSDVNRGLLSETLDSANKDIFSVALKSNSTTDKSNDNSTAVLSSEINFNRGYVIGEGSKQIQQGESVSSDDKVGGFSNSTSGFANVNAYYKWTDTATKDNTSTGEALATGEGVGVPSSNGNIFLQYGQKASFSGQFDVDTQLRIKPSSYLYQYGSGYDDKGLLNIVNKNDDDNTLRENSQKKAPDYYNTSIKVLDGNGDSLVPTSDNVYEFANTGTSKNKKAKVTATVTNKIRTTSFTVEKLLADGSENAKHKDDDFLFEIKASKIFGTEYKDDSNNTILKSVNPNFNVVKTLVVKEDEKLKEYNFDEATQQYVEATSGDYILVDGTYTTFAKTFTTETKEEEEIRYVHYSGVTVPGSYSTYKWDDTNKEYKPVTEGTAGAVYVIKLKADEKAVFDGIPVDSVFEVEELVSDAQSDKLKVTVDGEITRTTADADATVTSDVRSDNDNRKATVIIGTDVATINSKITNNFASKIPVLYRYYDREIVNGQPTKRSNHFTYYVKWLDGDADSLFNDSNGFKDETIKDKTNRDNYIKNIIIPNAEVVDNILFKYTLNKEYTDDRYKVVATPAEDKTDFDTNDPFAETSDTKAVDLQACMDDIKEKGYTGNIIIAKYNESETKYTVTAYYPDTSSTIGTGHDLMQVLQVKFNTSVDLGKLEAQAIYKHTVKGEEKECTFAYWERLVTVRDDHNVARSVWTPVSSNYDYAFRVVETTTLRAVYYYEEGGKRYRISYGEDYNNKSLSPVELQPLEKVYNEYPEFNFKMDIYEYFYVDKVNVHTWIDGQEKGTTTKPVSPVKWIVPLTNDFDTDDVNTEGKAGVTYTEFSSQQAVLNYIYGTDSESPHKGDYPSNFVHKDQEVTKEYVDSLPLEERIKCYGYYNPTVGNDATATDRKYDMYTQTTTTTNEDGSKTANVESRTRINVVFGAAGSPDVDTEIKEIGYILFKNSDHYPSYNSEDLKQYVNGASFSGGSTKMLKKSYTVNDRALGSGEGYSGATAPAGTVNLTNKNRYQIVFDVKTSNKDYYTCYTYMKRSNGSDTDVYISNTPANFTPTEAEYIIRTNTVDIEKEYYVNTQSIAVSAIDSDGNVTVEPSATVYGKVETNSPVAIPRKSFTIKATQLSDKVTHKKGKLVRLDVGKLHITDEKQLLDFVSKDGCSKVMDMQKYFENDEISKTTVLEIKAYFMPYDDGITVQLPDNDEYYASDADKDSKARGITFKLTGLDSSGNVIKTYADGDDILFKDNVAKVKVEITRNISKPLIFTGKYDYDNDGILEPDGFTLSNYGRKAEKIIDIDPDTITDESFYRELLVGVEKGVYLSKFTSSLLNPKNLESIKVYNADSNVEYVIDDNGVVLPQNTRIRVKVTPKDGYKIKSESGYNANNEKEFNDITVTNYSETNSLRSAIYNGITTEAITYNVTINTNDSTMGTASGTYTPSTGGSQSGGRITVSVPYGTTVNLSASLNSTDYKFDSWTATTTGATISNATSTSTTATISGDTTITANFSKKDITVYFAFIDQENHLEGNEQLNNNYAYPKDITNGGFNKPSDANDGPYWSTTNLKAYSNSVGTEHSYYMGYMSYNSGSTTHKATVYKFVISNIGDTVYFTAGNGGQQTNTATLVANKVYFASNSVSNQKPDITSNDFSSWSAITGRTITLTSSNDYDNGSPVWAIYYWGGTSGDGWSVMSNTATNKYSTIIPSDATGMKLVRVNPAKNIGWNTSTDTSIVWNETGNLTVSDGTKLTITGWGTGKGLNVSQSN